MKELKFDRARFDAGEMPTRTRNGMKVLHVHDSGLAVTYPIAAWIEDDTFPHSFQTDGHIYSSDEHPLDLVHEPRMLKITVGCRRSLVDPTELVVSAQPGVLEGWRKGGLLVAEHTFEVEE